ncbi:hypothetical protein T492DRAFT_1100849 [Pavlovales sp. CCMP2436]|nr:hypothetical protein T492DRAFT_1100849 [Pavlovales sp. CCMP2436]
MSRLLLQARPRGAPSQRAHPPASSHTLDRSSVSRGTRGARSMCSIGLTPAALRWSRASRFEWRGRAVESVP